MKKHILIGNKQRGNEGGKRREMWDQKQTFSTSAYFKPSLHNEENCVLLFQRTGKDLFFYESCSPGHPFFC